MIKKILFALTIVLALTQTVHASDVSRLGPTAFTKRCLATRGRFYRYPVNSCAWYGVTYGTIRIRCRSLQGRMRVIQSVGLACVR
jgi:hypothetical protein